MAIDDPSPQLMGSVGVSRSICRSEERQSRARAAGKLRGRKPKLSPSQEADLFELHQTGAKGPGELAELVGVARSTVYRTLDRARAATDRSPSSVA